METRMKVLVPVKRVIDYNVKVRVKADGSGVDLANVKMSMNPFDEIAVEEAIRLKEKGIADEIVAVSIGVEQAQETLRTALAMGADRAILIVAAQDVHQDIEPLAVAKLLKAVIDEAEARSCPLRQAGHRQRHERHRTDAGGPAGLGAGDLRLRGIGRGRACGRHARGRRRPADGQGQAAGHRDGRPAAERAALCLAAQHHEGQEEAAGGEDPADYGVDVTPRLTVVKTVEPATRKAGVKVASVDELITKLKDEAGVL
jgi:electron transfer flavoprotein beta subunit